MHGCVEPVIPSVLHVNVVSVAAMFSNIRLKESSQECISAAPPVLSNQSVYKSIRSSLLSYFLMHCAFLVSES